MHLFSPRHSPEPCSALPSAYRKRSILYFKVLFASHPFFIYFLQTTKKNTVIIISYIFS